MSKNRIIKKVWENKGTKQLIVTIPKDQEINTGDYVEIVRIPDYDPETGKYESEKDISSE